jgi:hypothetical protein
MASFHTKTFNKHDDYMTPASAWEAIKDYIPRDKEIWEPFYGDGTSGKILSDLGFNVTHEPIDFFKENHGEVIVSNPPFTLKQEVLERLNELDKPFILIMPSSTLITQYMRRIFGSRIQILIPRRRIQFRKINSKGEEVESGKCNFDCFYFCYKMNLPRDIVFLGL